jgi:electron transfer flavoprotein alpha/beta subunit
VVEQDLADSFEIAELPFPCLITVEKRHFPAEASLL